MVVFLFPCFIIYFSFLSYIYLENEVHAGISIVHAIFPHSRNKYCILLADFNGTKNHTSHEIKKTKLPHILPSSPKSNAGSRSACSPSFAACSFGINNFYFVSFIYVAFLNFHVTLPPASKWNRRQFSFIVYYLVSYNTLQPFE